MRILVKLDGVDWLQKPFQSREFIDCINAQTKRLRSTGNLVHAVISGGGGAGGTSVAITLAHSLRRQRGKKKPAVALFDLDFSTAAVGAYLNIENSYDLKQVLHNPERVDLEFIDIITKKHESGISVYSFESPEILASPRVGELALRMLDVVTFQNDHTVVDIPSRENSFSDQILSSINSAFIVTNMTIPSIQRAKNIYKRVVSTSGLRDEVTIVINKSRNGLFTAGISKSDARKVFGDIPVVILPEEHSVLTEALDRGVLPSEVNSRSKFCSAIAAMAEKIKVKT